MYATVTELRNEGVTEAQASDPRLERLIDEASRLIDRATGWFFEPRPMTLLLDGRGTPSVEPPVPPIRLDQVLVGGRLQLLQPRQCQLRGAGAGQLHQFLQLPLVDGGRHGRRQQPGQAQKNGQPADRLPASGGVCGSRWLPHGVRAFL